MEMWLNMDFIKRKLRSRIFGSLLASLIITLACVHLPAQVKVLRIDPQQTDSAIEKVESPDLALYDPQATSNHRLFVFLPGTKAKTKSSLPIDTAFTQWGYHAIALDYENGVLTVACAHSTDSACFDHYREAIITGAPVSEKISVDSDNSILNRLAKLLVYLAKKDPAGGWGEFVNNGQPAWSHIVIAGHSQGSGHAAYIGKLFSVERVLIFSGPQDYLDDLGRPAPWQFRKSATPPTRFFAFLNENDPYNVHHQIANCAALMEQPNPPTKIVEPGVQVQGNAHILINQETVGPHGTTLHPEFENVWHYMATAPVQ